MWPFQGFFKFDLLLCRLDEVGILLFKLVCLDSCQFPLFLITFKYKLLWWWSTDMKKKIWRQQLHVINLKIKSQTSKTVEDRCTRRLTAGFWYAQVSQAVCRQKLPWTFSGTFPASLRMSPCENSAGNSPEDSTRRQTLAWNFLLGSSDSENILLSSSCVNSKPNFFKPPESQSHIFYKLKKTTKTEGPVVHGWLLPIYSNNK